MNAESLLVGVPYASDVVPEDQGAVLAYSRDSNGQWSSPQVLTSTDDEGDDPRFGSIFALHDRTALVGFRAEANRGVEEWVRDANGLWSRGELLVQPGPPCDFATGIALEENRALIRACDKQSGEAVVHVFARSELDGAWSSTQQLVLPSETNPFSGLHLRGDRCAADLRIVPARDGLRTCRWAAGHFEVSA